MQKKATKGGAPNTHGASGPLQLRAMRAWVCLLLATRALARPYASAARGVAPPPIGLSRASVALSAASLTGGLHPRLYEGGASFVEVRGGGALALAVELELAGGCEARLAAVVDGRRVFALPLSASACRSEGSHQHSCEFALALPTGAGSVGRHVVAVYASTSCAAPGSALLVGGDVLSVYVAPAEAASAAPAPPALQPDAAAAAARPWIGSYYSGLQVPSASYFKNLSTFLNGATALRRALTVEDVLVGSSAGDATDLTFDQVALWYSANVSVWPPFDGKSVGWPQSMPATGYWYPYTRRPGEVGILPDEEPALLAASLEAHAAELDTAGVDYVLGDGTNLSEWPCAPSDYVCQPDLMQLRPFEVVTEAWSALRGANHATPAVGVWGRANNGDGAIWREYMRSLAYNASSVGGAAGLAPVSPVSGKPLFLLATGDPKTLNATLIAEIIAVGGVQVAPAWVCEGAGPSSCPPGLWLFEAPCVVPDPGGGGAGVFTSYLHPQVACNHTIVRPPPGSVGAPLGNMTAVTFSVGWNSQAFVAPGKMDGLLVIKMFEDIWASSGVQNIFIPSFNELFIGPQNFSNFMLPNEFAGAMGGSSGPSGAVLPSTRGLWNDGYADGRSRAFEPTEADGGAALELLASCVRVTALLVLRGWAWGGRAEAPCGVAGEVCCQYRASMYTQPVWSLERRAPNGTTLDALATTDAAAVAAALASGGYVQLGYPWWPPQRRRRQQLQRRARALPHLQQHLGAGLHPGHAPAVPVRLAARSAALSGALGRLRRRGGAARPAGLHCWPAQRRHAARPAALRQCHDGHAVPRGGRALRARRHACGAARLRHVGGHPTELLSSPTRSSGLSPLASDD